MDKMQILQNFSVDVSKVIKQHIKDIKKLDPKTQRELGRIIGDFKDELDSISESVNEGNAFTGALFKARKEGLAEGKLNESASYKAFKDIQKALSK